MRLEGYNYIEVHNHRRCLARAEGRDLSSASKAFAPALFTMNI